MNIQTETFIQRGFRNHKLTFAAEDARQMRLGDVPDRIKNYLRKFGADPIFDVSMVQYARSLGTTPLPPNWETLVSRTVLESAKEYLTLIKFVNPADRILQQMTGEAMPELDPKYDSFAFKFFVQTAYARKLQLESGATKIYSDDELETVLQLLDSLDNSDAMKAEGKRVVDVINSPLCGGSVHGMSLLLQYKELSEEAKKDLNVGLYGAICDLVPFIEQIRAREYSDSATLIMPSFDDRRCGIEAMIRVLQFCSPKVKTLNGCKNEIFASIPLTISRRCEATSFQDQLRTKVQLFTAGGGVMHSEELSSELTKALQESKIIAEHTKDALAR